MVNEYNIDCTDYIHFGEKVLKTVGVPQKHASILIEHLLNCDQKGIYTHGIIKLSTYIKQINRENINPDPHIKKINEDSLVRLLDGDNGLGAVIGYYAMHEAIEISKENGIGVVGVRNSTHFGAASHYAEMASHINQIGIVFSNSSPNIAPTGSVKPLLGNNPWSISVPTNFNFPITMDIANSIVAKGKIRLANTRGESIPLGWALNKLGEPTTDPQEVLDGGSILPIGNHKGYGIALMIEILSGVLTGAAFGNQNTGLEQDSKRNNGHLFLSVDIKKFMDIPEFKDRLDELINMIKSLPKINEDKEIMIPGELEWDCKLNQKRGKVKLTKESYNIIEQLSTEYKVHFT